MCRASLAGPQRRRLLGAGLAAALGASGWASGCADAPRERRSRFLAVDGGSLYVEETGSGPAVVLLHGFTLDARMWDDQWSVLARDHRVVRYDLRGFGRSSLPTGPYSHADDCVRVLRELGIERASLVGLSAGGRVALDTALVRPDAVTRLVLIDAFVGGYVPSQGYRDSFAAMIGAARGGDIAAAKALWLGHPLFAPARRRPEVAARLEAMVDDYSGFHWAKDNPERALAPPSIGRLGEVRSPTLVVVGALDIDDVQAMSDRLAGGIPGARKLVVPDAGHMSNMEAPAAVNAALVEFLA